MSSTIQKDSKFATARSVLDQAEAAGLTFPFEVTIAWHNVSEEDAAEIVQAFPDAPWAGLSSGGTEWVTARVGPITMTGFLTPPKPAPDSDRRAKSVIAAAQAVAS